MTKRKEEQQGSGEQSKRGRGRESQPLPWFAVDWASRNHPKVHALARRLKTDRLRAYGLLVSCWGWVAQYTQKTGGVFADRDIFGLAADVGWTEDPVLLVEALRDTGWLEGHGRDENGRFIFHDWDKMQEPIAQQRIRERDRKRIYRAKKRAERPPSNLLDLSRGQMRDIPGTSRGLSPSPSQSSSSLRAQSGFAGSDSNSLNRRRSASSSSSLGTEVITRGNREEEEDGDGDLKGRELTENQAAFEAIQALRRKQDLSVEPMPSWWPAFFAEKTARHGPVMVEAYALYLEDDDFAEGHRWSIKVFRKDSVCEQRLGAAAETRRVAELG